MNTSNRTENASVHYLHGTPPSVSADATKVVARRPDAVPAAPRYREEETALAQAHRDCSRPFLRHAARQAAGPKPDAVQAWKYYVKRDALAYRYYARQGACPITHAVDSIFGAHGERRFTLVGVFQVAWFLPMLGLMLGIWPAARTCTRGSATDRDEVFHEFMINWRDAPLAVSLAVKHVIGGTGYGIGACVGAAKYVCRKHNQPPPPDAIDPTAP